jgi:hypothetical protein
LGKHTLFSKHQKIVLQIRFGLKITCFVFFNLIQCQKSSSITPNLAQFSTIPVTDTLAPSIAISTPTQTVCEGESSVITAIPTHGGNAPLFQWFLDGVQMQSDTSGIFILSASPGTHQIACQMVSSEHCINGETAISNVIEVTVYPSPQAMISGNDVICFNDSTMLTASGGVTYQWSTGDTTATITVSPADTTTYMVEVTDANGCTGSESKMVAVNDLPIPSANSDSPVCEGDTLEMQASGGETYQWVGPGRQTYESPIVNIPSAFLDDDGTWTVTVTNQEGCTAIAEEVVEVNALPDVYFEPGCLPETVYDTTAAFVLDCGKPPGPDGVYYCDTILCDTFDPEAAGKGEHEITYFYTDANGCSQAVTKTITVEMTTAVSEGSLDQSI